MRKNLYGERELTSKQFLIVELLAQGYTYRQIGKIVGLTEYVVKNYLRDIFDKTGMSNKAELAVWYWKGKMGGDGV